MIVVRAPSRLHFGLLSIPGEASLAQHWVNHHGQEVVPGRWFGGVGLMVDLPGLTLSGQLSPAWQCAGPLAERVQAFARLFAQAVPAAVQHPVSFKVEHCAPEHGGLGTGTQLGMAVGKALCSLWHLPELDILVLAQRVGRGRRSCLGIHGFGQGGFLVDGGKGSCGHLAPLVARVPFPEEWRLVLVVPARGQGLNGQEELEAFERIRNQNSLKTCTGDLCRLVLLGLLPALQERDLEAFGEALYDFNVRVGAAFAPVQSGIYTSPRTADLASFCRRQGIRGVGQSSWGPTFFAVVEDVERASFLAGQLRDQFALEPAEVLITGACNYGAISRLSQNGDRTL